MAHFEYVNKFHKNLCQAFQVHFKDRIDIINIDRKSEWSRSKSDVAFYLIQTEGSPDFISRNRGDDCPVLKLYDGKISYWASWYEIWKPTPKSNGEFELKSVSWTFFAGNIHNRKQYLRAEWENMNLEKNNAPQPHWHFDQTEALVESKSIVVNIEDFYLQLAMSSEELHRIDMLDTGGIHLAMGGWHHKTSSDSHENWQHPWKIEELATWASKTLNLARHEISKII